MEYKVVSFNRTNELMEKFHINSLLSKVLEFNDYQDQDIISFMNDRLIYHDFSLFEDADIALDRIHEAIDQNEKICIYGDYDCDGILATTILVQAFKELGVEVGYHIPNRFTDGYGLNIERVKQIADKGYSLIITVDNGIVAYEAIDLANDLGIDVIVTDHHALKEELPESTAIIHTKVSPDYPFKEICGGFVAYKLASALLQRQDKYLYCLAAITTISDMMPLLDENRLVVKRGLEFMNKEHYQALDLLLDDKVYNTTSLSYSLIPKINSFGRLPDLCHPNVLVKYFLKDADKDLLMKVSTVAKKINDQRKSMTTSAYNSITIDANKNYLFYGSEDLHEGIVGLIAGRYTHEHELPSFIMYKDTNKGVYKGSARSVQGFKIHEFFNKYQDLFIASGGHDKAGGFTVSIENYEKLHKCIDEELKGLVLHDVKNVIELDENDLSVMNVESLSLLEPFGMANEQPLFKISRLPVNDINLMGNGKHIKINSSIGNSKISVLYFNAGEAVKMVESSDYIDIVGNLSINEFRNIKSINFVIKAIL